MNHLSHLQPIDDWPSKAQMLSSPVDLKASKTDIQDQTQWCKNSHLRVPFILLEKEVGQ